MKPSVDPTVLFSLKEVAVLSRLPEGKLRREVERKIIKPAEVSAGAAHRLLFAESEILYFAMLKSLTGTLELTPQTRTRAWRLLINLPEGRHRADKGGPQSWDLVYRNVEIRSKWIANLNRRWSESISEVLTINWDALIEDVGSRVALYRHGLERIHEDEQILGGEPVFNGTRLAVRHIGRMHAKGEPVGRILEDYPDLTAADVEFARLYTEAHPMVGRPSSRTATA
jgi:uncharacterized protein (DUF433 family)